MAQAPHTGAMIPLLLARNATENWGESGRVWLAGLPGLVETITAELDLTVIKPYRMTFHWVATAVCADGTEAVLKLGVPDGHLDAEAEALRVFDGQGAVRLLAENAAKGALLVERAVPGTTLAVGDEAPESECDPCRDLELSALVVRVRGSIWGGTARCGAHNVAVR